MEFDTDRLANPPLALVGGLPSSATYFAVELARDLLARGHGACQVVTFNDLSEATAERIAEAADPTVPLSEIPDAAVADAVRDADFPILIVD